MDLEVYFYLKLDGYLVGWGFVEKFVLDWDVLELELGGVELEMEVCDFFFLVVWGLEVWLNFFCFKIFVNFFMNVFFFLYGYM